MTFADQLEQFIREMGKASYDDMFFHFKKTNSSCHHTVKMDCAVQVLIDTKRIYYDGKVFKLTKVSCNDKVA